MPQVLCDTVLVRFYGGLRAKFHILCGHYNNNNNNNGDGDGDGDKVSNTSLSTQHKG